MSNSISNGLYSDPELAQFYEVNDKNRIDYEVCVDLAKEAKSVLDLGCGTGVLSAMLAENAEVTAVDPAAAMLDIGRQRYAHLDIKWIEGDARSIRLNDKFDFIVLSGHAFQCFLTQDDQCRALKTIATHLSDQGQFVFDSRNPFFPDRKERVKFETLRQFKHSNLGEVEAWNVSNYDEQSGILTYSNSYRILQTNEVKTAQEQIKYTPKSELAALINDAGMDVLEYWGDWHRKPFHQNSREIIPIGCRK